MMDFSFKCCKSFPSDYVKFRHSFFESNIDEFVKITMHFVDRSSTITRKTGVVDLAAVFGGQRQKHLGALIGASATRGNAPGFWQK